MKLCIARPSGLMTGSHGVYKTGVAMEIEEKHIENQQRFAKHLGESVDGVLAAAKWLNGRGYSVTMHPSTLAKNHAERMEHIDGGDLFINMRIEVKTLGINFTNKKDWKFGDKFIVCAKHSFDIAKPQPYAYIIQSADLKYMAVVAASTSKEWYVEKRTDSRYVDYTQDFYLCPIDLVKFFKV